MARLLTLILLLTACATDRAPDHAAQTDSMATDAAEPDVATQSDTSLIEPGTHPDRISDLDRFIVFGLRRIGYSYDEIVRALGQPDSAHREPIANRHMPTQIDTALTVFFPAATVNLYRAGTRDLMAGVTVRETRFLADSLVVVGMPWTDALRALGPPDVQDGAQSRWSCRVCVVDQQVVLHRTDDRVAAIGFAYYVD